MTGGFHRPRRSVAAARATLANARAHVYRQRAGRPTAVRPLPHPHKGLALSEVSQRQDLSPSTPTFLHRCRSCGSCERADFGRRRADQANKRSRELRANQGAEAGQPARPPALRAPSPLSLPLPSQISTACLPTRPLCACLRLGRAGWRSTASPAARVAGLLPAQDPGAHVMKCDQRATLPHSVVTAHENAIEASPAAASEESEPPRGCFWRGTRGSVPARGRLRWELDARGGIAPRLRFCRPRVQGAQVTAVSTRPARHFCV